MQEVQEVDNRFNPGKITGIKVRLISALFGVLFFFLFSSEVINAIFNNKLDAQGASLMERIVFGFKPTVLALYFVLASILAFLVLRYLKPLFIYLRDGMSYSRARTATIRVPWVILIFQIVAWTIGTTAYYMLKEWNADSGIPYALGIAIKLSGGVLAGMYVAMLINLILLRAKEYLRITSIKEGENDEFSRNKDYYAALSMAVYLIVNLLYMVYYFANKPAQEVTGGLLISMVGLGVFYFLISFGIIVFSKQEYRIQVNALKGELQSLAEGKAEFSKDIYLINFDELGEMAVYVNGILDNFGKLIESIKKAVDLLRESSQTLSASSQENSVTSNEQAAGVSEVVSTMEDSNTLTKTVGKKVSLMSEQSEETRKNVEQGFAIIRESLEKMDEVKDANTETIQGIKSLSEEIKSIWDIVNIINGIAGQIKIIAFNAELEASAAGEAGKNFEIVASEIRRLADNTVNSTSEIKTKISEIESSSEHLIEASAQGTKRIEEEWEISQRIEGVFNDIRSSADDSAQSAGEITNTVSQQVNAFEQILLTMKQLSEGVNNFVLSTKSTTETARNLSSMVDTLDQLVKTAGLGGNNEDGPKLPEQFIRESEFFEAKKPSQEQGAHTDLVRKEKTAETPEERAPKSDSGQESSKE